MKRPGLALLISAAAIAVLWALDPRPEPQQGQRLRLATTTSTANSGLLTFLLEPFEAETGLRVQVIAVGTGQALELGRRGDCDLVLVHARAEEDEFVQRGHGIDRRDVMYNDFVILGPATDPAAIRGMEDPAAALRKVVESGAVFVSRGDGSGTHLRERSLWHTLAFEPEGRKNYLKAGDGMARCLEIANQKQTYILSDRGTYLSFGHSLDLEVLVEGHESLRNPYGAMLVNPDRHPHVHARAARQLLDFLTSEAGRARIGAFQVGGQTLFHPPARQ